MSKGHTVTATIVAAALGATIVVGGYVMTRAKRETPPKAVAAPVQIADAPDVPVRRIMRVKKVAPAAGADAKTYDLNSIPPMPDNLPNTAEIQEQFRMLRSFLELPPERLARIHKSIEKIEAMPLEQKERMLATIRMTDKPDKEASEAASDEASAKALLAAMPAETRALINLHTKDFSSERRTAFIEGYAAACKDASLSQ